MLVRCPHCGGQVAVNGIGRKPLNITVKNVCDAIVGHKNILGAANELGCSRAYIYKTLKSIGLMPADLIKRSATKDNSLLRKGG